MQLCWPRYPPRDAHGSREGGVASKPPNLPKPPANRPRQPAPANRPPANRRRHPPPTAANRYQVSKHGDPVKTALVVPGVMLLNGGIFLSIFYAISKLMAAKVGSRRRPRCWEVTLKNR